MNMRAIYSLIFLTCFGFTTGTEAFASDTDITCTDVAAVDFQNRSFKVQNILFEFRSGKAVNFDGPVDEAALLDDQPADWIADIEKDKTVAVSPKASVRFLLLHNDHILGSGWHYYFIGFACLSGALRTVLSLDGGLSFRLEQLDPTRVVTSTIPWRKNSRTYASYIWDSETSTYKIDATWEKKR